MVLLMQKSIWFLLLDQKEGSSVMRSFVVTLPCKKVSIFDILIVNFDIHGASTM